MSAFTPIPDSEKMQAAPPLRPWQYGVLAVLPLPLAVVFYFLPVLRGGLSQLPVSIDAAFYTYQLTRAGEVRGRWWELADDNLLGNHFHNSAGKNPGLYEGIDLILVSSVTSRVLPPVENYHLMAVLVLLFNGGVAGWMVARQTNSFFWGVIATVLITVNVSTALTMTVGHLNLFKYGWVLLAVQAFFRYLDRPTIMRGVWSGLSAALVLQGSFYFGYFLTLGLGTYWLVTLVRGGLSRPHFAAAGAAGLIFLATGLAFTFPVWTICLRDPRAGEYLDRDPEHVAVYSCQLFQYFVSPFAKDVPAANSVVANSVWETWHYPGWIVLLGLGSYLLARLRGWPAAGRDSRLLDRLVILSGIFVLLSLRGGPGALLYTLVSSFRCYGRAGLLAVALWAVAAPMILWGLLSRWNGRPWLRPVLLCVLGVTALDAIRCQSLFQCYEPSTPAWVDWLARQPSDVRLAAFPPHYEFGGEGEPGQSANLTYRLGPNPFRDAWNWLGLHYRTLHQHATLNGCELDEIEAELRSVDSSYAKMNPAGLRLIVQSGYPTLAFHTRYLDANSWIRTTPELSYLETVGDWHFYRWRANGDATSTDTASHP
jgi:hypothetical protein